SHLGIKILYSIINQLDYAMADRVYLPWIDLIELMREEKLNLFCWESRKEIKDFDILGITLQSELNYTNVLEIIDLCGIDIHSLKRNETDPIILAGGPCAVNPLPLAPFIDVFFIGEAEEGILQIAQILKNEKNRSERLKQIAQLDSCYVPSLRNGADLIKSRKYTAFHTSEVQHSPQILSWQLATHNRYVSEIMRGCTRGCRFCFAGYFYRPVREREPKDIITNILKEIKESGWDEVGLLSLSSSDYSCIPELLQELLERIDTQKTHIALPSLRVDTLDRELVHSLKILGREGLTIAPEAGSQRLRQVINKKLSEEQILTGIETALQLGWQKIKLYFMLGLPTETDADIEAIIALIHKIHKAGNRKLQINVTLSPFVPKPFTPFQWCAMQDSATLLKNALRIKNAFAKARNIKIHYHTIENSLLEALISRGDIKIAEVIEIAWKKGARFDGWKECFNFSCWQEAITECNITLDSYLGSRNPEDNLPWDFISLGIDKSFLLAEQKKALTGIQTPDCREICSSCGICNKEVKTTTAVGISLKTDQLRQEKKNPAPREEQFRYRVYYQKTGLLRFIAHLDWMRMLFRRISLLDLQTVFTQGFNPHPKVSLCPPLAVGIEGLAEYFDLSFYQPYPVELILQEFNKTKIPDFTVTNVEHLKTKTIPPKFEVLGISFPEDLNKDIKDKIIFFNHSKIFTYTKGIPPKVKNYNLKEIIVSLKQNGNELILEKLLESPSVFDLLSALLNMEKTALFQQKIYRYGFK
ncbi:MAG: TIGR03960 family B12-binding radical SAM protein, partial [Candidatus Cloacimonas sp.]|nr:TIGR03960 family B12-binding radical SAM protein [Candidatus Cloacimonas sp.]